MKRKDLISTVEDYLVGFGFERGQWLWQPRSSQLILIIGGVIKTINLRTNMTKRTIIFEMGRLAGLVEALGTATQETASQSKRGVANGADHAFIGMPA